MKIYRIAQSPIIMYHVTTTMAAEDISKNGFNGNRIYFTPKSGVKFWVEKLAKEKGHNLSDIAVIEVAIDNDFYEEEFYDWSKDQSSVGPPQTTYGEGKLGWNDPIKRPQLVPNDKFKILRIIPWGPK